MSKAPPPPESGPVGNKDPGRRGRSLPRQDRYQGASAGRPVKGQRGGKPGHGDVTKNPKS